jgi:DNA-binding response OmpR family regulator
MRLLLIEDSTRLQELLGETLRDAGYRLDVGATVAELKNLARSVAYDLIIVDLGLPDGDGLIAIRELRGTGLSVPILVVTARGTIEDRISGLDSGADDYLIKPFNHAELLARVRALLRRPAEIRGPRLEVGSLVFDEGTGEAHCDGRSIDLRPSERRLLSLLMRRRGTVIPKSSIEEALSEFGRELSPNAIEALVSRLRKALADANCTVTLGTVRGLGYVLKE